MDTVQNPPEQDCAELREEIDSTRCAMANKLEALEDKVMGTVQSAKETVGDSIQGAKDAVASVKRTFDVKHHIEQRPWTIVGGCFLAGLAVGHLIPRGQPRSSKAPGGPVANGSFAAAVPTPTPTPPLQVAPPRRPGVLDLFQEEIDKVKGIAIAYAMGLVRDSIKESVPQLASKIDDLMDGITTKLGG